VDSGDAALAGLGEPFGAADVRVEGRAGRAGSEEAFDDEGEVRGADRAAVRVLEARGRKSVYLLPPLVIFGMLVARAGISFVPAAPFAWA